MRCAAWIVLLWAMVAGAEPAEPTIVLVETRGAPSLPALASQVEIHAGRRAVVQTLAAPDRDPMTYADSAAELVASGGATVVVWIAPVDHGFLVFAAGGWPGRALLELVRVDADLGSAEIERTVALKIAGLLDAVLAPHSPVRAIAVPRPAGVWRIEVDGVVAREPHERGYDGRVALAAGRAWPSGRWTIAPVLAGYWQPTGAIDGQRGRASITELGAVLALEAARELEPFQLFARPRLTAGVLAAHGESGDGRRGDAVVFAPYAGAEAGVRRRVAEHLQLGLAIGSEVALIHHRLTIDNQTVVDIGLVRLHVGVSLTMAL